MVLKGLPESFKPFAIHITQIDRIISFAEFKTKLRSYEDTERMRTPPPEDNVMRAREQLRARQPSDQDQMKMMWFWFCWVLGAMVWASPPLFSLHPSPVIFSVAEDACPPGELASLSSDQEVSAVLDLVSGSNGSVFWVGLRKGGSAGPGGGSRAPQVVRWAQEPQETCTTLRCAAIKLNQTGTSGTSWGLIPVSCRNKNPYICKGRGTPQPTSATQDPEPDLKPKFGPEPDPKPDSGTEPDLKPDSGTEPDLKPDSGTEPDLKPDSGTEPDLKSDSGTEPDLKSDSGTEPDLKPDSGTEPDLKPDSGTEPDLKSDSGTEPDPCPWPPILGTRSLREDNSTRVLAECWSGLQLDLVCSGRPPAWRLTDGSVANQSTACQPCEPGFIRTGSGDCEDIDECSGGAGPCRTSCLNTPGSYRCFCIDDAGERHAEDSPVCAPTLGFLLPLLVAMAALVVLVVVVAVTVALCMRRKRAMKNKEGYEPANEKEAS
ncbi:C-type lectin domain family 14 member A [Trematomus bernacchii]|uniref:C-type lectin domain family 14 member A n=1 Tax=Trematomus bernacchii TaxID=40690 RepID=UPI00146DACDE|nr:C-type lectin domain family 14 member A [Trematomus bernacchii]